MTKRDRQKSETLSLLFGVAMTGAAAYMWYAAESRYDAGLADIDAIAAQGRLRMEMRIKEGEREVEEFRRSIKTNEMASQLSRMEDAAERNRVYYQNKMEESRREVELKKQEMRTPHAWSQGLKGALFLCGVWTAGSAAFSLYRLRKEDDLPSLPEAKNRHQTGIKGAFVGLGLLVAGATDEAFNDGDVRKSFVRQAEKVLNVKPNPVPELPKHQSSGPEMTQEY